MNYECGKVAKGRFYFSNRLTRRSIFRLELEIIKLPETVKVLNIEDKNLIQLVRKSPSIYNFLQKMFWWSILHYSEKFSISEKIDIC